MDGLAPVVFWAISPAPKRAVKWLFAASPPVPKHLRNGVNSGTESLSSSAACCLRRRAEQRAWGVFFALCGERNSSIPPPVFLPLCLITSTRRMLALPKHSSPPPPPPLHLVFSLSRLSGEALCLFTLPGPPCKLSHCGITDGVTHREVQGTTERTENEADKRGWDQSAQVLATTINSIHNLMHFILCWWYYDGFPCVFVWPSHSKVDLLVTQYTTLQRQRTVWHTGLPSSQGTGCTGLYPLHVCVLWV